MRLFRSRFVAGSDAAASAVVDHGAMPGKHHVLVAGGGVAALEAMVLLRREAADLVDVELLSPDRDFFYRPLAVGEPFGSYVSTCGPSSVTSPAWKFTPVSMS